MSVTQALPGQPATRARLRALSIFAVSSAFAFIVSGATLSQPPVWDGAMSVYPAAIELARTDFDLGRLLSLPTYFEGGPNTHSISLWTLVVAAGMSAFGSLGKLLPLLHVVSLALYGLLCLGAFRILVRSTSQVVAIFGTLVVGLFPPLLVQAADIYIDLPVACLGIWSIVALLRRRYLLAATLITISVWIKPLGVLFVPLMVAHFWRYSRSTRNLLHATLLVAPAVTVLAAITFFGSSPIADLPIEDRFLSAAYSSGQLLLTVPDTLVIVVATIGVAFAAARRRVLVEELEIAAFLLVGAFAFVLLNPLLTFGIPLLPRYYIAIVPISIVGLVAQLQTLRRIVFALLAVLALWFVVNLFGAFYPYKSHATYAVAERSFAYQDLLAVQMKGVALLEDMARTRPIYYDYYRYFQFEYPEMGYTRGPVRNGLSTFHNPEMSLQLEDLPARFAMLFEYPTIGGSQIEQIWRTAAEEGAAVTVTPLRSGSYVIYLIEVDR